MKSIINKLANWKDWMTWFNHNFWDIRYAVIDKNEFPIVESKTGELFYIHPDLCTYTESLNQYSLEGLCKYDTVIDIGANIGAFSFIAIKKCFVVHAFEPIEYDTLTKNIEINKEIYKSRDQGCWVIPHKIALGSGEETEIEWNGKKESFKTLTLTGIKKITGRCNFLKCDAEGAEWDIHPEELADIRRIEIEFHHYSENVTGHGLIFQISKMFDCTTKYDPKSDTFWVSGVNKDERL